ncbi:pilus assembly PilX N-terminal domain-containing protein [Natranaerobius thermophilus]|uniref:Type 4 fimbrial biogenesis protein PilX N-terminal domain-containing protein n=1 Tax=Natranaerobius thermophilus (strain ATCC BAA-1301 / DSM 18059 / JW/NM-WN-LF) TaxID=457570 RepID=B2A559_NATTJ|nr:pilus assembly PilX N-terminal domain-containing protein [Natranaerobius thermophilus]ACB85301.1 hypothetical protein Nther_1727 [Natranaerobius thermophilus JW/NM-WN-LF]
MNKARGITKRKKINNETGSMTVLSLVILMILIITGIVLLEISVFTNTISVGDGDGIQAAYNAEAGLEYALFSLKKDWEGTTDINSNLHNQDYMDFVMKQQNQQPIFELELSQIDAKGVKVTSKGYYYDAITTSEALIEQEFILSDSLIFLENYYEYVITAKTSDLCEDTIYGETYYLDSNQDLTELAPVLENIDKWNHDNIVVHTGDVKLDSIPSDPFVLVALEDDYSHSQVIVSENVLSISEEKTVVILSQGEIKLKDNKRHYINGAPVLIYSESKDTGISFIGGNISLKGSFITPRGRVTSDCENLRLYAPDKKDFNSLYQLKLSDFNYPFRR